MSGRGFIKSWVFIFLFGFSLTLIGETKPDSLILLIKQTHELNQKANLLYELSVSLFAGKPDTSLIIAYEALDLSKGKQKVLSARIHKLIGDISVNADSVQRAVSEYEFAKDLFEQLGGEEKSLLETYVSLGNIYIQRDNLPEALDIYNKAVMLSQQGVDTVLLPRLYNNLGIINLYINNTEKALKLYSKALDLFKKRKDTINIAGTTTNIGSIYVELGNYEIARSYYIDGLDIFKSINLKEGEAHALLKLGMLESKIGNYKKALGYFDESIEIQKSLGITYSGIKSIFLAETLIYKGIAQFDLSDDEKAYVNLRHGYEIASESGDIGLLAQASEYISKYFKLKSDYKQALEYHEVYKKFSDSINNQSSIRKLTRLEMKLQYEGKLHDNQMENQAKLRIEQKNTLYSILAASVFLLGMALFIVLLKLEKNKKNKARLAQQNLEEKLEHTNKELTTYVMYLLRKNEFIISISEKLKQAKLEAKVENKQRITDLIKELEENSKMFSWEEFELRFQQVYTSFYKNLNEKYPNLSQNEIRLCAFAKLNMTTKEIAAITYQSVNSISVARYRLRKKMGLSSDENLYSLLSEL